MLADGAPGGREDNHPLKQSPVGAQYDRVSRRARRSHEVHEGKLLFKYFVKYGRLVIN
jgi:hypothetical protein